MSSRIIRLSSPNSASARAPARSCPPRSGRGTGSCPPAGPGRPARPATGGPPRLPPRPPRPGRRSGRAGAAPGAAAKVLRPVETAGHRAIPSSCGGSCPDGTEVPTRDHCRDPCRGAHRQAGPARVSGKRRAGAADGRSPQPEPLPPEEILDAVHEGVAGRAVQGSREVPHDLGIGAHRRERVPVFRTPAPHDQALRADDIEPVPHQRSRGSGARIRQASVTSSSSRPVSTSASRSITSGRPS